MAFSSKFFTYLCARKWTHFFSSRQIIFLPTKISQKSANYCYFIRYIFHQVHVVPLPPTTHIDLPPIKVEGHYLEIHQASMINNDYSTTNTTSPLSSSNSPRSHGYLSVSVYIGSLEQNLTTDLLNHMIFFQKGFVKVCIFFGKKKSSNNKVDTFLKPWTRRA